MQGCKLMQTEHGHPPHSTALHDLTQDCAKLRQSRLQITDLTEAADGRSRAAERSPKQLEEKNSVLLDCDVLVVCNPGM